MTDRDRDGGLSLTQWCAWAQSQDGLVLTIDDFAEMPLGEQVGIVPFEAARQLLLDEPGSFPLLVGRANAQPGRYSWTSSERMNVAVEPRIFFVALCRWFVSTHQWAC